MELELSRMLYPGSWYSVDVASRLFGISSNALRNAVERGSVQGATRKNGVVEVLATSILEVLDDLRRK